MKKEKKWEPLMLTKFLIFQINLKKSCKNVIKVKI